MVAPIGPRVIHAIIPMMLLLALALGILVMAILIGIAFPPSRSSMSCLICHCVAVPGTTHCPEHAPRPADPFEDDLDGVDEAI